MEGKDVRWASPPAEELLWDAWENSFTVYHRVTGETHLLNALPAEIVHILSKDPLSLNELSTRLAVSCETEANQEWCGMVLNILNNLYSISLVYKLTPCDS